MDMRALRKVKAWFSPIGRDWQMGSITAPRPHTRQRKRESAHEGEIETTED